MTAASLIAGFVLPLLGLSATAWVLGRGATRALGLALSGRLEKAAISTVLGLALVSFLLFLLGLAGRLQVVPVLLAVALVHIFGAPVWREIWEDLQDGDPRPGRHGWLAGLALLAVAVLPFVLPALYPPSAFDATLYHLPFARAFAETGGLPYLTDRRFPVFPQANEILFAAVMLFGRDVAAQGVQLLATLLTALLLALWARRSFPDFRAAGALAAAIFLGNPLVSYLAGTGYIEPGLTLFVTGGLFAADRWRERGDRRWLVPAAVLAATAADVKYLGLYFLGAAALLVAFAGVAGRKPRPVGERGLDVLLFGGVALVFLAPWYLRLVILTGNPVFPYVPQVFGANPWQSLPDPNREGTLVHRLVRAVRIPWDVVFARQTYGGLPPVSPVYLAAIPVIVAGAIRNARLRHWLAVWLPVVAFFALACSWLPRDSRYLVPVLPLASLAVVGSVAALAGRRSNSRLLAWALCLGCLAPGWLYGLVWMARNGPLPLTPARREAFLAGKVQGYAAISWLNHTRGKRYSVWALHAEQDTYFADGRFLGDWAGLASFGRVLAASPSPEALHRELRRLGADHLLVVAGKDLPFPEDATFQRWFEPVYQDAGARVYALR
ncbi:MAG TPA: glycosyltransferase family 39 protein [Thermoanaerobaculia bacterium]|jgi:4-amino-4-deoxy-L-arabinose transferase-like glycosyltransferase|nr:glycosyltransferase family 39 protein [Thermoanaerobaculia bacterium]